jgi:predicted dienelactone hydrolase
VVAVAIAAFVVGRISVSEEAPTPVVAVPVGVSGAAPTAAPSAVPAADVPADEVLTDYVTPLTAASQDEETEPEPIAEAVYYRNCSAARAAGAAPIREGEAGYASHLDRDGDGVACE